MCHVCGFICYLCVELKLMINTRSLPNQTLKSAHPSRLSSRCWPWGVFIGAGQPLQHGEVRDTNLAWVRPMVWSTCGRDNKALEWTDKVLIQIRTVDSRRQDCILNQWIRLAGVELGPIYTQNSIHVWLTSLLHWNTITKLFRYNDDVSFIFIVSCWYCSLPPPVDSNSVQ